MERTPPNEIGAPFLKRHPRRLNQSDQAHLSLQPLDLTVRDAGHQSPPKIGQGLIYASVITAYALFSVKRSRGRVVE